MKSYHKQRGVGIFGFLVYAIVGGFFAIVIVKSVPVYINAMSVDRAIRDVAIKESGGGDVDAGKIKKDLNKRWEIDYITEPSPNDIEITRGDSGLLISYDYEAREHLLLNIDLVIHFANSIPVK